MPFGVQLMQVLGPAWKNHVEVTSKVLDSDNVFLYGQV